MTSRPKVSVCITTYNRARYLPECLDSVLTQSYRDFEIVVVDDGSTDGTDRVLADYQRRFPDTLFCFWHAGRANKGISASSNVAISNSRGEYLAWIGSDDVWLPDMLAQQIARLENHPRAGLVYSYAYFIDEDGRPLPGMAGKDITHDLDPVVAMLQACHPPAMTVIFRRACLDDVGGFDESLVYGDWDLMVRAFARWEGAFVDKPLALYRLHGQNTSKGINPQLHYQRILDALLTLRRRAGEIGGRLAQPRNRAILELEIAHMMYRLDRKHDARLSLYQALARDPTLAGDLDFVESWLSAWKAGYDDTRDGHFGLWALAQLTQPLGSSCVQELADKLLERRETAEFFIRRGVEDGLAAPRPIGMEKIFGDWPAGISLPWPWRHHVLRAIYRTLLFETYHDRQLGKLRAYLLRSVQFDPAILLNRGVLSIGLQSFLGLRPASLSPDSL